MERSVSKRKVTRNARIQCRDHGRNCSASNELGFRLPSSVGVLTIEPNPYRSSLLEETERELSFWSVTVNAKWKNMTRRERAALIYGYVLGLFPGILFFSVGWWGVKYLWPMVF